MSVAGAASPDGLCTVEEMRASYPYCPVCECETIPLRDGTCAFCDTLIAPKREEAEQREHEAERHRVYKLSHKDQINKRRRELRRERKGHVRSYRRACDALTGDSCLNTAQVMPCATQPEPPYLNPERENGAVRAGLAEATYGEIAELAPAPQLSTEVV